jgi:hypothetical protein
LEDRYPKLTLFKIWVPFFKSDERLRIISKVFFLKKKKKKKKNWFSEGDNMSSTFQEYNAKQDEIYAY